MKLTDRKWKEFFIDDVFNVNGTITTKPQDLVLGGNTPRITCASTNNGLDDLYKNNPTEKGRVITIDSATVGFTSYQGYDFIATDHVEKISLKYVKMNVYIGLFLKQAIDNAIMQKYNYGYKFSQTRIRKQKILLPINDKNEPDYQFMEDYIKEIMHKKRQEYIDYAKGKSEQNSTEQIIPLYSKKWKEFFVVDIFPSIQRGKRLIKDKQVSGNVPYVSSTAMNNGVDNFIQYDSSKMRKYQNCLSVANSGSVGASFYEPFEYVASDHVTHLKNDNFNRNIYLFIAAMTNRWSQKYNFNREINDPRISREKILLPVNNKDEPDYAYMEQYVNNILMQKYNDYLEYAEKSQNIWNT